MGCAIRPRETTMVDVKSSLDGKISEELPHINMVNICTN